MTLKLPKMCKNEEDKSRDWDKMNKDDDDEGRGERKMCVVCSKDEDECNDDVRGGL